MKRFNSAFVTGSVRNLPFSRMCYWSVPPRPVRPAIAASAIEGPALDEVRRLSAFRNSQLRNHFFRQEREYPNAVPERRL
jgi:hypothetical protein